MARLGDAFVLIRNGASIKQTEGAGGIPITRIETIANREVDRNKFGYAGIPDIHKYSDYVLQDEDILMSHINSEKHLGKAAIYKKIGNEIIIHGMNLLVLRANPEIVCSKYAFYYFETPFFRQKIIKITKKSVNQASFTVTALKDVEIPLPSLKIQKDVASTLDRLSELVSLRKHQLAKLDELVKARFVEMFGDLTRNPKKWKKEPLGNHVNLLSGFPFDSTGYANSGVKICGGLIIMPGRINWQDCKWWPNPVGYENYLLADGDIVMALDRPWISEGFKIALISKDDLPSLLIQRTARIRAEDMNQLFVYFLLQDEAFSIHCNVTGSLVPHISSKDIKSYPVIVPPMALQDDFAAFSQKVNNQKPLIQQSLDQLELLKKSLMQEYFGR